MRTLKKGYTALHEACNRGHTSVARLLVNSGAEVNVFGGTHDQKETPLHDAARNGHYQVRQAKSGSVSCLFPPLNIEL